jgi:hypothetical protein
MDSLEGRKRGEDKVTWTTDRKNAFMADKQAFNEATMEVQPCSWHHSRLSCTQV